MMNVTILTAGAELFVRGTDRGTSRYVTAVLLDERGEILLLTTPPDRASRTSIDS